MAGIPDLLLVCLYCYALFCVFVVVVVVDVKVVLFCKTRTLPVVFNEKYNTS